MNRPARWQRHALLSCFLAAGLTGCLGIDVPTQNHPICSWGSQPPKNSAALCGVAFRTLRTLARADFTGNVRTIRRLVPNRTVARRIIQYGVNERRNGVHVLHIVPSIALDNIHPGYIGAGFYLLSESRLGRTSAPETVYLRVRGRHATVVADQPAQDW